MTLVGEKRQFLYVLIATLLFKLAFAALLPITGDEAYFVLWGRHLDYGYYDHPPLVGWILYGMLFLGASTTVVRLPAVLLSTLIGIGIYYLLRREDPRRAFQVASLWLLLPINVVNVLISTDTPLILFSFLSGWLVYEGLRRERPGWFAAAGVCLGLAFLSKYFAVLLGVAYVVFFLGTAIGRRNLGGLALLILCALPFGLINLYWNYTHCWTNLLFNLVHRTRGASFSLEHLGSYGVILLYLATPPVVYYLIRNWRRLGRYAASSAPSQLFLFLAGVPLVILAIVALRKSVGLHWVLSFLPFIALAAFYVLDPRQLRRSIWFMLVFSALHAIAVAVVLALPLHAWKEADFYRSIVFGTQIDEILERLRPYRKDFHIAADSYVRAAVLRFHYDEHVSVFGPGSYHARQDDMITDFRKLDGENFLIIAKSPDRARQFARYFQRAETPVWTQNGAKFPVTVGYNFDYEKYRDEVLRSIHSDYYTIPEWLPCGACYFHERYFPATEEHTP